MVSPHQNDPVRPIHEDPGARVPDDHAGGEPHPPQPGFDQLRKVVQRSIDALQRRRRAFFLIAGAVGAVLAMAIALQTPLYRSTSLMLLKFGRELVYQPEIGVEQTFAARDRQTVINSELAILRSQAVLEGAVREVGVENVYPNLAEELATARAESQGAEDSLAETMLIALAVERLRASFSTLALPETDVLQISYDHPDPIVAQQTVDALVDHFTIAHLNAYSQPEIVKFLAGRLEAYGEQLAESESLLRDFQAEHKTFALEAPQAILLERRTALLANAEKLDGQATQIRLSHLQEDLSVTQARSRLLALEEEVAQLQGTAERDAHSRIQVVQRFIAKRKAEVDGELQKLAGQRSVIDSELADIEMSLAKLPELGAEHRRLVRQRDADEEQYRTYQRKLRDARLSSEMDRERIASINVIQQASVGPQPVWPPNKKVSLGLSAILALLAGGLTVLALDRLGPVGISWLDGPPEQGSGL
jgi:uncharacterized protein involved in exopolysaccharide biosynthesis